MGERLLVQEMHNLYSWSNKHKKLWELFQEIWHLIMRQTEKIRDFRYQTSHRQICCQVYIYIYKMCKQNIIRIVHHINMLNVHIKLPVVFIRSTREVEIGVYKWDILIIQKVHKETFFFLNHTLLRFDWDILHILGGWDDN